MASTPPNVKPTAEVLHRCLGNSDPEKRQTAHLEVITGAGQRCRALKHGGPLIGGAVDSSRRQGLQLTVSECLAVLVQCKPCSFAL